MFAKTKNDTLSKTCQNLELTEQTDFKNEIIGLLNIDYLILTGYCYNPKIHEKIIRLQLGEKLKLTNSISVMGGILKKDGGLTRKTGIFKIGCTIFYDNIPFMDLLTLPNQRLNGFDSVTTHTKIRNEFFYTISRKELKNRVSEAYDVLKLEFLRINRIDICFDAMDDLYFNQSKINYTNQIFGAEKMVYDYSTNRKKPIIKYDGDTKTFGLSPKSKNTYVRCYDKLSELEHSKKDYILSYLDANGFAGKKVYRTEIQLGTVYLNGFKITLDDIFIGDFVPQIFEKSFQRFQYENIVFSYDSKPKFPDLRRVQSKTTRQKVLRSGVLALEKMKNLEYISDNVFNLLSSRLFSDMNLEDEKSRKFLTNYDLKASIRKKRLNNSMMKPEFEQCNVIY